MICRLRRQVASRHQHAGAFDEPAMVEPRSAQDPHRNYGRSAPASGASSVFEPQPPSPLPGDWHEPSAAVSRPQVRGRSKRRVLPWVMGIAVAAGALAVGHHWYDRLSGTKLPRLADPAPTRQSPEAPYSLRAAWRDVERRQGAESVSPSGGTSVISVLDEPPGDSVDLPEDRAVGQREPTPAALLAERMAAAAAADAAASGQRAPGKVDRGMSGAPPQSAIGKPSAQPPGSTLTETPRLPSPVATEHVPAAAPGMVPERRPEAAQPAQKVQRVPGMVGLGGPPARGSRDLEKGSVAGSSPSGGTAGRAAPRSSAREVAQPPSNARRSSQSASAGQSVSGNRTSRPRKPLRRLIAPQIIEVPPEPPITGMSIFNRLGRAMP